MFHQPRQAGSKFATVEKQVQDYFDVLELGQIAIGHGIGSQDFVGWFQRPMEAEGLSLVRHGATGQDFEKSQL